MTPDALAAPSRRSTSRMFVDALLDLALPDVCAACDDGPGPICHVCEDDLTAGLFHGPRWSVPTPAPPHLPPVVVAGPYDGVLRTLVTAYKDDDRRDLRPRLAGVLAPPLAALLDAAPTVVVPVPSSRAAVRRRGDEPVTDLARAAVRALARRGSPGACVVVGVLRPVRAMADQSGLGHGARAENLAGAYAVRPRARGAIDGRRVVLVDDVVTTGATLAEAACAVRAAGGDVVGAAALAATQRRVPLRDGHRRRAE